MNNCIGEKNRVVFIVFLGLQFSQFLVATIDIFRIILREEDVANEARIFWAIVLVGSLVSLLMVLTQLYLVFFNITTCIYWLN